MSTDDSLAYGKRVFNSMGFSDEVFYGVAGSLMGESGRSLNPNSFNGGDPNGGSYGMGQWHGDRRAGLERLAKATGRAANDYTVQWDWIAQELKTTEKAAFEALTKARNRHEAAKTWTNFYERPNQKYANHDLRAEHADHVASTFGSGVSTGNDGWGSTDERLMGGDGSDQLRGGTGGSSAGASSSGADPNANPLGFLTGLTDVMGMTRSPTDGSEVRGPVTAGQGLALAIGSMIGGPQGLQMAATLFGAGNTPKQLTMAEGIGMGIGGLIGGIPGSFIGQALGSAIQGLFTGQNPFAPPGTPGAIGTPSPFAQTDAWGSQIEPGFWSGDTGWGGNGGGDYGGAPSVSGLPQRRPDDLNTSGGSYSDSGSSTSSSSSSSSSGGGLSQGATQGSDW
jgi:hypothetical protein